MHDIEPFFRWRDQYVASEDPQSPFFGHINSEFEFSDAIYNYVIHPQWDSCGSPTLFLKVLFVDYDRQFALIELLGEWNDAVQNDVMSLKREVINEMIDADITQFVFFCDNLLNFHTGDDDYYEEWIEEICESDGWVAFLDTFDHVADEMGEAIAQYVHFGPAFNGIPWREMKPEFIVEVVQERLMLAQKRLH